MAIIPGTLRYKVGDATIPEAGGLRFVVQVVNNIGAYGAGFSGAVSKRWKKVEDEYRRWHRSQINFKLGEIQFVPVQSDTMVVNMIAQNGIVGEDNPVPIKYDALEACLDKVGKQAQIDGASICGPRFGAGLAAGDWTLIEPLIIEKIIKRGVNVSIYDLEEKT